MAAQTSPPRFINRPDPRECLLPYNAPLNVNIPTLRGLPLTYLSQLVANVGVVADFLWSNTGLGKLRDLAALKDEVPQYDPTVVRISNGAALSAEDYLRTVNDEDWSARRPASGILPSFLDYHDAYLSGAITPLDVLEALLPLIRRDVPSPSPHATAFLDTQVHLARRAAEQSTERYRARQPLSPLDGVPIAVKDESDVAGYEKTLGSRLSFTRADGATSFGVAALQRAGAVLVGKTNMHELGVDTTNCNPVSGTPANPYAGRAYFCGGSSGGSAYAVAAGIVPLALGNDGGGSVRLPAANCGVFGLKTSHGRASVRPTVNAAASTGVSGPLAANMLDLDLAFRIIARPDPADSAASLFAAPSPPVPSDPKPLLAICRPWFDRADPAVHTLCSAALDHLTRERGYEVIDVSLPLLAEGQLAHAMTILAEISAAVPSNPAALSPATRLLLAVGARSPAADLLLAQRLRALLMRHLAAQFDAVRRERGPRQSLLFVTPTSPLAGWRAHPGDFAHGLSDADTSVRNMEFVWLANFTGCPALTAPVGYVDVPPGADVEARQDGVEPLGPGRVPVGLMAMGEWGDDEACIAFGYEIERFLHLGMPGGRPRPRVFVDVLADLKARRGR